MSSSTNQDIQSLSSMAQVLAQQVEIGVNISPYLSAIQSLNGQKPGEKYKELNSIVKNILATNTQGTNILTNLSNMENIPAAMIPLIRILIGSELKSNDAVLEALKSEDKTVVNQALRAKWFFDSSNIFIEANYFMNNVMPYVSVYTRYRIIKNLSTSLIGADKKAEDFFNSIVELYSFEEALPLLPACSERFIFDEIIKRGLHLTHNMLLTLYQRYPMLAIRYLNLGNKNKSDNIHLRFSIHLGRYKKFLPLLIKHHPNIFLELYNSCDELKSDTNFFRSFGATITSHFFKNASNNIIIDPGVYLKLIPLKTVSKKLSISQFEYMYANLFPNNLRLFNVIEMIRYLAYYPKEKRLNLLTTEYKRKYSHDLIIHPNSLSISDFNLVYDLISVEFFEELYTKLFPQNDKNIDMYKMLRYLDKYTREDKLNLLKRIYQELYKKNLFDTELTETSLLILLPPDVRKKQILSILERKQIEPDTPEYYIYYCYMPPEDSFPVFKNVIKKTSDFDTRLKFITYMLDSCKIDKNPKDFLDFLTYYNTRHKNERIEALSSLFPKIKTDFNINNLSRSHWQIFLEILLRAHTKNELQKLTVPEIGPFFDGSILHATLNYMMDTDNKDFLGQQFNDNVIKEDDKIFLDKVLAIIITYNVEGNERKWLFIEKFPTIQMYCLDKLINLIPFKYPESHSIWETQKSIHRKLHLIVSILEALQDFNYHRIEKIKKTKNIKITVKRFTMVNYPWLVETAKEILNNSQELKGNKLEKLKKLIKKNALEFYDLFIGDKDSINIKSGKAWIELKKNEDHILSEWTNYLSECRDRLTLNSKRGGLAAKRFLLTLKWYNDLPIKFLKKCLEEITVSGSIKVLAILLEGDVFSKLASTFIPQQSTVDVFREDSREFYQVVQSILPAMNITNPPVSFDVISLFCQGEYVKLAIQTFTHTSNRVSKSKIMIFAENLFNKPVSIKKHGIQLIFKIATKDELLEFVKKVWHRESHVSIREILTQLIYENFAKTPNDDTWTLMEICIDGLTPKDEVPLDIICKVGSIDNQYVNRYIRKVLNKITELSENGLEERLKINYISAIWKSISYRAIDFLSEEEILEFLQKYYFDMTTPDISEAATVFAMKVFNQPFVRTFR